MNDLLKYKEKLADIKDKMEAIHKKADEEQDGVLTEEQEAEWEGLSVERDQARKAEARAQELRDEKLRQPAARRLSVGSGITHIQNRAERDPAFGFYSPREFINSVLASTGIRSVENVQDERLRPLAAGDGGYPEDADAGLAYMLPRAFTPPGLLLDAGGKFDADGKFRAAAGSDEHGEYDYGRGGAAIPFTLLPGILQLGFEGDPTIGRTQMVPMASPTVKMLARVDKNHTTSVSGGFTVTRRPETTNIASSRTELEAVVLDAASLFGLAYATNELLADSPISFVAIIEAGFRDQFAHEVLKEKLRGLGGEQYLGYLTALVGSSLGPTIAVTRTTSSTIKSDDVLNMQARCWGFDNSIWIANHDCRPTLTKLAVVVSDGGATPVGGIVTVYQPSLREGQPDRLLGRPIFYSEYASTLGSAGDLGLYNWSQFLEGIYQPLQSDESVHVRFVQHESTFKFWIRNAGAPWWREALTPNQSSDTLSPSVIIAA